MRQKNQVPGVAIVGYTNAGKSTLLNALSGSSELAEDKLFATLDPVTRRVQIEGRTVLFTDTVGFIKKLPHDLIDAFRSTLEEAVHADILLHVVDASSSESREQYQIATEVLASLGAGDKPVIVAYNKMDAVADEHIPFDCGCPHRCFISAQSGQGMDTLLALVMQLLSESVACLELKVGYGRGDVLSLAHTIGEVKSTEYEADGMRIVVEVPQNAARQLQPYAVAESTH